MSASLHESKVLSYGKRNATLFIVEGAVLSGLSIVLLIGYMIYRAFVRARARGRLVEDDACDSSLFLSLMLGEALRAIGKLMSIRWIVEGAILAPTTFCDTQGVVQLLATNIIDWSTLAIAIQTTLVLVTPWRTPEHLAKYLVLAIWVIVTIIVGSTLGVHSLHMFSPDNFWCWHRPELDTILLLSEYVWMWSILFFMMVLYIIDALIIRGSVSSNGWRLHWASRGRAGHPPGAESLEDENLTAVRDQEELKRKEMALQLFLYPVVYFITVTPFSITEWENRSRKIPYQAAAVTSCIFTLSGFFNVILYFKTRPGLFRGADEIQPQLGEVDLLPLRNGPLERPVGRQGRAQTTSSHLLPMRRGIVEKGEMEGLHWETYNATTRRRSSVENVHLPQAGRDVFRGSGHGLMKERYESGDGDEDEDVGQLPP